MTDDALEQVRLRNNFYRDNYRRVLATLLIMVLVNVLLVVVICFEITHPTPSKYFATSAEGRIIPLHSLDQPVVTQSALLQWAARAGVAAYTYNFVDYRAQLQEASDYFTPQGWTNFEDALKGSRNLETVLTRKLVVTAVPTGAPIILDQAPINGRYAWKVQMPILVTYQSASTTYQQPLIISMLVTRVPDVDKPDGIAIAQFVASQQSGAPA